MRLSSSLKHFGLFLFALSLSGWAPVQGVEAIRITLENYDDIVPAGKEIDAIVGDWVLRNDQVSVVIAHPTPGRKANMTVRGVGGMVIDFTRKSRESDQLSCYYPAGSLYLFEQPDSLTLKRADDSSFDVDASRPLKDKQISLSVAGVNISGNGTSAVVTYTLRDGQAWLDCDVAVTNQGAQTQQIVPELALRCDGSLFRTDAIDELGIFFAEDRYFGQCYGIALVGEKIVRNGSGRNIVLRAHSESDSDGRKLSVEPGQTQHWSSQLTSSQGLPGIQSWGATLGSSAKTVPMQLKLQSSDGPVEHAKIEFRRGAEVLGLMESDEQGFVRTELVSGEYTATINAIGREQRIHEFEIESKPVSNSITLKPASRVRAHIADADDEPIAAKVQFVGIDGTETPDFGPDSAIAAIKNVVYCAHGNFSQPIDPGKYRVIVSHGPEYDAEILELEVLPGGLHDINCRLPRTVDTTGWISAEFHSHSSPSGDNVSHQTGRVLNLLAEHIEFAPCTEHNRVDTYADDLQLLGATQAMATCTGMELTGSPLPINHQNAFPIHRHPHLQDGGGPDTDADPVKQIERLALWDNSNAKVVQTNHPNLPQILGDRDLDGKPDGGFHGMLDFMDVVEIHPPQDIFETPALTIAPKDKNNRMFYWMQLLNLGYRIPGVVNTDAHYNFHGSGWLRNYLRSSAMTPSEISVEEVIHVCEHGQMVMTTGPFLEVGLVANDKVGKLHGVGEEVLLGQEQAALYVRIQCSNWLDVNRVQVFANGRPLEGFNFTRQSHPAYFSNEVIRFEQLLDLPTFEEDTHLIVATIGEGLKLGPVMGPQQGELPPVAVANPIFLDIDGGGFRANGDDLGVPLMLLEDH
ncbi:MAG: CehA/McbA family metallohydrolase [Planctomycetales bacterium]|nr:CehA/McbA family metallohydrolase [Planctomycetales bacterium]